MKSTDQSKRCANTEAANEYDLKYKDEVLPTAEEFKQAMEDILRKEFGSIESDCMGDAIYHARIDLLVMFMHAKTLRRFDPDNIAIGNLEEYQRANCDLIMSAMRVFNRVEGFMKDSLIEEAEELARSRKNES